MVEIKELVVRATVVENSASSGAQNGAAASSGAAPAFNSETQQQLIEDCVRQVLAILERKNDR